MCLPYSFSQSGALDLIPIETVPCLPRFYLKTNATMTYKVAVQEKYTLQVLRKSNVCIGLSLLSNFNSN